MWDEKIYIKYKSLNQSDILYTYLYIIFQYFLASNEIEAFIMYIYPRSTHWLTYSSIRIMLLYPIWSLSPGSGLVFLKQTVYKVSRDTKQSLQIHKRTFLFWMYIGTNV